MIGIFFLFYRGGMFKCVFWCYIREVFGRFVECRFIELFFKIVLYREKIYLREEND